MGIFVPSVVRETPQKRADLKTFVDSRPRREWTKSVPPRFGSGMSGRGSQQRSEAPGAFQSLTELIDDIALAQSLALADVTTAGNRQAFVNLLTQANSELEAGRIEIARQKVSTAIARTDGWSLRGTPDANEPGKDWIIGQSPAVDLYNSLTLTLAALDTL